MARIDTSAIAIGLMALVAAGCPVRELAKPDPAQCVEQYDRVAAETNRDIDILFVIDNSGSMEEEQDSLAANFQRFINVLEAVEGGLPNLHIGVISTDVGCGDNYVPNCDQGGDRGRLQAVPRSDDCPVPENAYIEDVARSNGTRIRNYEGNLADVFSCIARLGTDGCNFEQPLESMRRALDGSNPDNAGFLRSYAFLVVVIISDEDDCSTADATMFSQPGASDTDPLGPMSSFRCFEFGVECEPDSPRETGSKAGCMPRVASPYMHEVDEYVTFLKELKRDPDMVLVAAVVGNPAPVIVGTSDLGMRQLEPSCVSSAGSAVPAVRLEHFLEQFPERSTLTTICNEDLSDALTLIAEEVSKVVGDACIGGEIDGDPDSEGIQHDCLVSDVRYLGEAHQQEDILSECSELPPPPGELPCWHIEADYEACPDTATSAVVTVERGGVSVPLDTEMVVRCAAGCAIQ